eukprot:SAG31_NODE_4030_length_3649_cov_3.035493_1_plen_193_part_00
MHGISQSLTSRLPGQAGRCRAAVARASHGQQRLQPQRTKRTCPWTRAPSRPHVPTGEPQPPPPPLPTPCRGDKTIGTKSEPHLRLPSQSPRLAHPSASAGTRCGTPSGCARGPPAPRPVQRADHLESGLAMARSVEDGRSRGRAVREFVSRWSQPVSGHYDGPVTAVCAILDSNTCTSIQIVYSMGRVVCTR